MIGAALSYTVVAGDTYSRIAAAIDECAGVSYQQIEAANPSIPATGLEVGQQIAVPAVDRSAPVLTYTVRPGDTYSSIAGDLGQCKGVTVGKLIAANQRLPMADLHVGDVIEVPPTEALDDDLAVDAPTMGYWDWTYGRGVAPANATMGLAFYGVSDVTTMLEQGAKVHDKLLGARFVTFGGGGAAGAMTSAGLSALVGAVTAGRLQDYDGLAFDVESGERGLRDDFAAAFEAAKAAGLEVLVTVSHSAPFGIDDAAALMAGFFASEHIDFLSPQLYTTGSESANDYATSHGVDWTAYAAAEAKIVPSIVRASYYPDARKHFEANGVTTDGYIQWSQVG